MILSKSALHYKFWMLNYSKGIYYIPDNNFCNYFWSLLFAVVFLPLTWLGLIYKAITKSNNSFIINFCNTIIGYAVLGMVAMLLIGVITNTKVFFIGLGFVVATLTILFGIFYFFYKIYPNTSFRKNVKETSSIIKEGISSFKNSYCPQINWNGDSLETDSETNQGN